MIFYAVIGNARHSEYGVATIPFPIPDEAYAPTLEMLELMGIGDPLERDCYVKEVSDAYPILKRLETNCVNLDELDYLAKRIDSFGVGEDAQFEGAAAAQGVWRIEDFINLTFCCQQATVVQDFRDLEQIGKQHLMAKNGGAVATEVWDNCDFRQEALNLLCNEPGRITSYGVVYTNGMKLEPLYQGGVFPEYLYDSVMVMKAQDSRGKECTLFLPVPEEKLQREVLRAGVEPESLSIQLDFLLMPKELAGSLCWEKESVEEINTLCKSIASLQPKDLQKLGAAAVFANPEDAAQLRRLAENLDLFDYLPGVKTPEEYGRYMIQESGHFDYDENLEGYYNYEQYGLDQMHSESGQFIETGYVSYQGAADIQELMEERADEAAICEHNF